ncbi:MAG: DUF4389 domain-containing protein [Gammaproteobacteria bacterium]|nr:DUF4389 domain-containing protein [Gammaproteobacteria bacterium]
METQEIKGNLSNVNQWLRIAYMLLFGFILYFVMMVMWVVVVVQAIFTLVTGKTNENLAPFSNDLSHYISHIVMFLTYNQEAKPFPFSPWGQAPADVEFETNDADSVVEDVQVIVIDPKDTDTK